MVKWLKRSLVTILCAVAAILVMASPAFATALPDSTPAAEFYVYRNLLETGDWLGLIYQNIPYATTPPGETVWQDFMWRMIDTDNITEIATAVPYAFNDNGFGYNVTSIYLNADNVTSANITWNTSYNMRLSGNPIAFTSPPEYNFNLSAADYSTLTAPHDVQAELAARILLIASNLDIQWGLGASYSLLNETETGTVLSIYGEAFFRGAIYGLQGLCPQIFAYVINDLDITPRTWSTSYVTTLQNQYAGTWVDTAKSAGAALFGTTYDLTSLLISLLICAGIGICSIILSGDAWHGVADARTGLIAVTRLGFFDLGFLALLAALAVIYGASRLWSVMR
jgi:hypothetical protein